MSKPRVIVSMSIIAAADLNERIAGILNIEDLTEDERERLRDVRTELTRGLTSARMRRLKQSRAGR